MDGFVKSITKNNLSNNNNFSNNNNNNSFHNNNNSHNNSSDTKNERIAGMHTYRVPKGN